MSSAATPWKAVFQQWPPAISKKGVVVNTLGEAMPFKGFLVGPEMLLLERTNPDTLGSRYIMLSYDSVACVKFIDPSTTQAMMSFGLAGKLSS